MRRIRKARSRSPSSFRTNGRDAHRRSEGRWQQLVNDLDEDVVVGLLVRAKSGDKEGVRLSRSSEARPVVTATSSVVDVALGLAAAWRQKLDAVGKTLAASGRATDDPQLWAAVRGLAPRLPEGDEDRQAWDALVRSRTGSQPPPAEPPTQRRQRESEPTLPGTGV